MRSLNNYIKESLLDDFDILDKSSEIAINKSQTIGNDYDIHRVYMSGPTNYFCNTFNKRKIKKYTENLYWKNQEICAYDSRMYIIENKSTMEMLGCICNIILSGDKTKLTDKEYIKSLFKDVVKDESYFKCLLVHMEIERDTIFIELVSTLALRSPKAGIFLEKKIKK